MKILGLITLSLFISCGKTTINRSISNNIIKSETKKLLENVKCYSDGSYTECTIVNNAVKILNVLSNKPKDCLKGTDYYLLDEKTLVVRNKCKATFLIEVE